MSKSIILFSGYNDRALIAFIRTLERNNIDYSIIASSSEDQIFNTQYSNRVIVTRNMIDININDISDCIDEVDKIQNSSEYLIAPSTEYLNRFLINNKEYFAKKKCTIPLVDKDLYETISNKKSFSNLCIKSSIAVPAEFEDLNTIIYPFVAKPRQYFAKDGSTPTPVIIFNEDNYNDFVSKYDEVDFYYQQYIGGDSYYLLYYFYKNGKVRKYSQINYLQQPGGKSIIAAESASIHLDDVSKSYENLFIENKFHGLVMVEIKYYNDEYYMIEANPRFWGPSQLFVDAKVNLFEDFLSDFGFMNLNDTEESINSIYFWFGGIIETLQQGKKPVIINENSNHMKKIKLEDCISKDVYNRTDTINVFNESIGI